MSPKNINDETLLRDRAAKSDCRVGCEADLRTALQVIDRASMPLCLVCDEKSKILGIITDGDIRRALLKGADLSTPAVLIMNRNFHHLLDDGGCRRQARGPAARGQTPGLPMVGQDDRPANPAFNLGPRQRENQDNIVVIMAGGYGARLRPLTEDCPKPLLKVGGKPLLEHCLLNFKRHGFRRFYISINYKGHMIVDYLKDGSAWDVEINYLEETTRLGTAGALALLPRRPDNPLVVINGDVIMRADIDDLISRHRDSRVTGTMCVRQHHTSIPFGVVHTDGRYITNLVEKPSYTYFISAGVYCLNPEAIDLIPRGAFFDMTDLFEALIKSRYKTTTYFLEGPWVDVGSAEDYDYACRNLELLGIGLAS